MRIGRLELHGFKSFPDRTQFLFGSGISCVVGPNGSGKSNVVDALKWCVGEQSAKSLRGSEMQDVIFAGSSDRKPVGFAEVKLTLSADKGEPFPGEYAQLEELEVGRRLHRSGTSEYLINQNRVRRRDVIELFMDTGIGANLYSFIEQGQVDKMVRASPGERRQIVDEAAGIARYKVRRDQARSRLEATANQLDRVSDVEDEMARRLRSLERQVLKAARFRRLRALVRQDELDLSLVRYDELSGDRRALRGAHRGLVGQLSSTRRELARRESDLELRRSELEVIEAEVGRLRDALADVDGRRREVEATRSLQMERAAELARSAEEASAEASRASERAAKAAQEATDAEGLLKAAEAEVASATDERERAGLEAVAATELAATKRAALDEADRTLSEGRERSEALTRRLAALHAREEALPLEVTRSQQEVASWEARQAELADVLVVERADLEQAQARASHSQREVTTAEARVTETRERVLAAEQGRSEVEAELAALEGTEVDAHPTVREASANLLMKERALEAAKAERDSRLEERQRARRREVELAWQRVSRTEAEASARVAAWRAALVSAHEAGLAELERRFELQRADDEAAHRTSVEAAEAERRQALVEAETRASEVARQRVAELSGELDKCSAAASEAARELRSARRAVAECEAALDGARARADAVAREEAEALASLDGPLARQPSVLASLGLTATEAAELGAVVGARLALPVVGLAALQEAVSSGQSLVAMTRIGTSLRDQVEVRVERVEGLAAAVEAVTAGAAAALDVHTGVRIEADGLTTVPRSEQAGRHAAERAARAAAAQKASAEAEQRLKQLRVVEASATAKAEEADAGLTAAREALGEAESGVLEAVADARRLVQAEMPDPAAAMELARVKSRERWHEARDAALRALSQSQREMLETVSQDGASAVAAVRELADAAARGVEDAEREHAAALVEQLDTLVQAAEEELTDGREALRAARMSASEERQRRRDVLHARRRAVSVVVSDVRAEADAAAAALGEARGRAVETKASVDAAAAAAARTEQELARCGDRLARASEQLDGLKADVLALGGELGEVELAVSAATESVASLDESRAVARDEADQAVVAAEEARSLSSTAEVRYATAVERNRSASMARSAAETRRDDALSVVTDAEARRVALESTEAEARVAAASAGDEATELESARAEAWEKVQDAKERLQRNRKGLSAAESNATELRASERDLAERADVLKSDLDRVQQEIELLRHRADERYQTSLPALLDRLHARGAIDLTVSEEAAAGLTVSGRVIDGVPPRSVAVSDLLDRERVEEVAARLEENRGALNRLGEVNLGAVEEFVELSSRHEELVTQREDLESSMQSIRAAIAKMNRTCRQRFRDAFDRINENFQEAYPRLVGGGAARLSLTDEDDLLETGVDIFVQPPGKRLQNLSLLSGGEKAMTAIALLIAVFQVKPSPFCVLDEVDAPLDEANGARFNEMLKDLSRLTQFVVVTHNRKTMECADALYGVTMADPGVSRLVSVDL